MNDSSEREAVGGNFPPETLTDQTRARLALDYAGLAQRIKERAARITLPHSVDSDEEAAEAAQRARVLMDLALEVEIARKAERAEMKRASDALNAFFLNIVAPVSAAVGLFQSHIRAWQVQKAEAVRRAAKALGAQPIPMKDAGRVLDNHGKVAVVARAQLVYRIVDDGLIPRDLLKPDPTAINNRIARLKAEGLPLEIPGLVIREELRTSIQ